MKSYLSVKNCPCIKKIGDVLLISGFKVSIGHCELYIPFFAKHASVQCKTDDSILDSKQGIRKQIGGFQTVGVTRIVCI